MKRTPQQPDGYRLEAADVAEQRERSYRVAVLTLCGRCEEFRHYGDPEEGRRAFLEHRNQTHPQAVDRGQHKRRRAAGLLGLPTEKPW